MQDDQQNRTCPLQSALCEKENLLFVGSESIYFWSVHNLAHRQQPWSQKSLASRSENYPALANFWSERRSVHNIISKSSDRIVGSGHGQRFCSSRMNFCLSGFESLILIAFQSTSKCFVSLSRLLKFNLDTSPNSNELQSLALVLEARPEQNWIHVGGTGGPCVFFNSLPYLFVRESRHRVDVLLLDHEGSQVGSVRGQEDDSEEGPDQNHDLTGRPFWVFNGDGVVEDDAPQQPHRLPDGERRTTGS